jgi:hypothetical protein
LCEYASSFKKLAVCESYIASWYSQDIVRLYHASSTPDTNEVQRDLLLTEKHINFARAAIDKVKDNGNARIDVPGAVLRIATIYGQLAHFKLIDEKQADQAFQEASQTAKLVFGHENPFWYYKYARYLVAQGRPSAEVSQTLAHIYNGGLADGEPVVVFLKNAKISQPKTKKAVLTLASADPQFKSYLKSLNWKEVDFKS